MREQLTYQWQCHPRAEALILQILNESLQANSFIEQLQESLYRETSTRLFDWLDHVAVSQSQHLLRELEASGFILEATALKYRVFHHPGAQLPRVVVYDGAEIMGGVAMTVDSIADFLMVRGITKEIEGTPFGEYRRSMVSLEKNRAFWVVERRASHAMEPFIHDSSYIESYFQAQTLWQTRPRILENEEEAMKQTILIADKMIQLVGQDLAAWIVLSCERDYWQRRNLAAQLQKNRQDKLGLGWANHDHHTFRSSRRYFSQLIRLFEMLGFYSRERFYAGKEAGWGAQVMEHPNTRLILFLDVDLEPEELEIDFRYQSLPERTKLGTVGLWCALHGDSILEAGMHHLEAQFMFDNLKEDLSKLGIEMMEPFSSFPFLHQAFTKGEVWAVSQQRIQRLLESKQITVEQAEKFGKKGAIGSHLENLQRREGYKGFNQRNVSSIILKTDPRNIQA